MPKGKGVTYSTAAIKSVQGSKSMSKSHMPAPQGKMSGAHGVTNGGGKHKTLRGDSSNMVGGSTRAMSHEICKPPKTIS